MKCQRLLGVVLGCLLAGALPGAAQESGDWRAASTNARAITGDVVFAGEKIAINFSAYPIAQIRTLKPEEISAAFNADLNAGGNGNLFRLSIPAEKRFVHKNTLCGSDETQWVASYVNGHNLQLAFFSGAGMPLLTIDALGNSPNLCGTFSYVR